MVSLTPRETYATPKIAANNPYIIADIAEEVGPAVVYIETTYKASSQQSRREYSAIPFFDFFFDDFFFPFPAPPQPGTKCGKRILL